MSHQAAKDTSVPPPVPETQVVTVEEPVEHSPYAPLEEVMNQAPLADTMNAVGSWLAELAETDVKPEPIPHDSPLPSPTDSSLQGIQRAARKEASSAKDGGRSIPPPVTAAPAKQHLPPTGPAGQQEVRVRAAAESGADKQLEVRLSSAAKPPVGGTTRPTSKSTIPAVAVAPTPSAVTGTSALLPPKSVVDAQVQGLLMAPGWSSLRACSKELLQATYSTDPFLNPLDFQSEQGTLGALGLNAAIRPPFSPSVQWVLTEPKAKHELGKLAPRGASDAAVMERIQTNKRLFAVSAGTY